MSQQEKRSEVSDLREEAIRLINDPAEYFRYV